MSHDFISGGQKALSMFEIRRLNFFDDSSFYPRQELRTET